jgi:hypothetical protein
MKDPKLYIAILAVVSSITSTGAVNEKDNARLVKEMIAQVQPTKKA